MVDGELMEVVPFQERTIQKLTDRQHMQLAGWLNHW